ncbi:MAG: hypothetical protein ACLUPF_12990 [Dorea sp.]
MKFLQLHSSPKTIPRTVGFWLLTPCIIPEVGHANFELKENEMAMGWESTVNPVYGTDL